MRKTANFIKKLFRKDSSVVFLLLIITLLTHIQWFNPFSILQFGDWQFRVDDHVKEGIYSWATWLTFDSFGRANPIIFGYPLRGILWGVITNGLNLSYDVATKITLFIPIALGSHLTTYIFSRRLNFNKLISFTSAIFYGSTSYFLILKTGHLPIAIAYILYPLFLLSVIDYFKKNYKLIYLLYSILIIFVVIVNDIRIGYIFIVSSVPLVLLYGKKIRENIKKICTHLLIGTIIFIGLNLYWLLPLVFGTSSTVSQIANRGLFGDHLFSISQSLTIFKWNWTGGVIDRTFTTQSIPFYFWIPIIIIFFGILIYNRWIFKNKLYLFSIIIFILGVFLTKQSDRPFATSYEWLYYNFPGFNLFREASKFYILSAISFTLLLSITLKYLEKSSKVIYYVCNMLIILVGLANLAPLANGSFESTFVTSRMPKDYEILNEFLRSDNDYNRTLWVPRSSRWGYYTNKNPKVSLTTELDSSFADYYESKWYSDVENRDKNIMRIFNESYFDTLLDSGLVKYIVLPIEDVENRDNFFPDYGDNRDYMKNILDGQEYLEEIDIGTSELVVYRNKFDNNYIDIKNKIYTLYDEKRVESEYNFINSFDNEFKFSVSKDLNDSLDIITLEKLIKFSNISNEEINFNLSEFNDYKLYQNTSIEKYKYALEDNEAKIYKVEFDKLIGELENPNTLEQLIFSYRLEPNQRPVLEIDDKITDLKEVDIDSSNNSKVKFGIIENNTPKVKYLFDKTINSENNYEVYNLNSDLDKITYSNPEYDFKNQISNSTFNIQDGWGELADCNNYDDDPDIEMQIRDDSESINEEYIYLRSKRHTACVGYSTQVLERGKYIFGFDYKSTNNVGASYDISLKKDRTSDINITHQNLDSSLGQWSSHSRVIDVDNDNYFSRITVYAKNSKDGLKDSEVMYDNFFLIKIPEYFNDQYLISNKKIDKKKKIQYELQYDNEKPHIKQISLSTSSPEFILTMSESYSDLWKITSNNNLVDTSNFKFNNFLNGWNIKTDELCAELKNNCDYSNGTYTLDFNIEYTPHRKFIIGLNISFISFIILIIAIIRLRFLP